MNCKKYRACLMGLVVFALVCGLFLYMKHEKDGQTPVDGMLVKNSELCGNEREA